MSKARLVYHVVTDDGDRVVFDGREEAYQYLLRICKVSGGRYDIVTGIATFCNKKGWVETLVDF